MNKDNVLEVSVSDGKYTVVQTANGWLEALRYGNKWRECVGDNLILGLAQDLQNARDEIKKLDRIAYLSHHGMGGNLSVLETYELKELATNWKKEQDLKAQQKP